MEYESGEDRAYAKIGHRKVKAGARVDGARKGNSNASFLEVSCCSGVDRSKWGATVGAKADAYVLEVDSKDGKLKAKARFFGGDVGVRGGIDGESFVKEGHVLGGEVKARATIVDGKVGPINFHLGAGASTIGKVEDGTVDLRLGGYGITVGKKIGIAAADNELSVDTDALLPKAWQLENKMAWY